MSTDLFGKYYNNPTKSSIYSNLTCNSRSADEISFDITNSEGVITDGSNTLASINLSDLHVPITQYTSDMKTIEPYSYIYIKGMHYGDTLMSKFYGKIPDAICNVIGWEYNCSVVFSLKYRDNKNNIKNIVVFVSGNALVESTFIDETNMFFDITNINIEASYNDNYIRFDSTIQGFEFWINHVMVIPNTSINDIYTKLNNSDFNKYYDWIVYDNNQDKKYINCLSLNDVCHIFCSLNSSFSENTDKCYLFEDNNLYISNKKYRNGAMKGIILKATYPTFNADDIYDYQEALKIAHITDRIENYIPIPDEISNGNDIHIRQLIDVIDTYNSLYDNYNITCSCDCTSCESNKQSKEDFIFEVCNRGNVFGLNDYCEHLTKNNLWQTIGQFYARTSISDDPNEPYCKNYIPSTIVYNPNPFPIIINYLTIA